MKLNSLLFVILVSTIGAALSATPSGQLPDAAVVGQSDKTASPTAPAAMPTTESLTSSSAPSPEAVADRMAAAFAATPVLHVTVINRHLGIDYECKGWLKAGHSRGEIRREGKLVFATASDGRRVQEFVPKVKFANGVEGQNVLIDREPTPGRWFCLVDHAFACGPGVTATVSYLDDAGRKVANLLLGNMQGSTMIETALKGQPCYWYHMEREIEGDRIVWDLYVDKLSFKPLRQMSRITRGETVKKDEVFDYTFVHLSNDDGIEWKLDPAKLTENAPQGMRGTQTPGL